MPRISLIVVAAALAVAQTASGWTFVWKNKDGDSSVEWGQGTKACKDIDHAGGEHFSWDPKDAGVCILMYADDDCNGNVIGRSCPIWAKDSSGDISAFEVVDADFTKSDSMQSSTTAESSTTSATTTSASMTTTTSASESNPTTTTTTDPSDSQSTAGATSEPTAAPSSDGGGLSGGAIAGIVVGIVAAVAIIALVGWILYRRHQRNSTRPNSLGPSSFAGATPAVKVSSVPQEPPAPPKSSGGGSQYNPESPSAVKWGGPSSPTDAEPGPEPAPEPYTTRPPPGTNLVELSDTSQLVELDGSSHR